MHVKIVGGPLFAHCKTVYLNSAVTEHWFVVRGVARRRPRGPGLNLEMLKKKESKNPDPFLHEIPYCHVEHCHFKSLLLASLISPDIKFSIFCILVFTHV